MFKTRNHADFRCGLLAAVAVALAGSMSIGATKAAAGPQLAHMVYFKLKDSSGANRAKLAAACKLFLSGHEGTVSFRGRYTCRRPERPFNDHEFDVSLHLVFANKEALDKYLAHGAAPEIHRGEQGQLGEGPCLRLVSLAGFPQPVRRPRRSDELGRKLQHGTTAKTNVPGDSATETS